jgi:hypothetical protein
MNATVTPYACCERSNIGSSAGLILICRGVTPDYVTSDEIPERTADHHIGRKVLACGDAVGADRSRKAVGTRVGRTEIRYHFALVDETLICCADLAKCILVVSNCRACRAGSASEGTSQMAS